MAKVHIVHPNRQYIDMFLHRDWGLAEDIASADLVQFTGGADVSPSLYGEERHPRTVFDSNRDRVEQGAFKLALALGKPVAGICRGGQFLNVMCGGSMYQHVDNHAISGTHHVVNVKTGELIPCTSTHHQMMCPAEDAVVIGVASESTVLERMRNSAISFLRAERGKDVEVLYYSNSRALCFQPHPEFLTSDSPCQQWYFNLIEDYLGVA